MATPLPTGHDESAVAQAADFAVAYHQRGMLAEAERLYAGILKLRPGHFDALHMLGVLRQQQGQSAEAMRLINDALNINPRSVDALCNFGAVLNVLKRHDEALAAFDQALVIAPHHPAALNYRGTTLVQLNRFGDALAAFDRLLAVRPDHLDALCMRGSILLSLQRFDEALVDFDRALAVKNDCLDALVNRGIVLVQLGRARDALAAFDQAIEINPDHVAALGNRARVLAGLQRHDEALADYARAVAAAPHDAEMLYLRGNSLWALGKLEPAIESFEKAWALDHLPALSMLVLGRLAVADWVEADRLSGALKARIAAGDFVYPYTSVVLGLDPPAQLDAARNYLRHRVGAAPMPFVHSAGCRSDKLRIVYLSTAFRQHPVAAAIAELLKGHDRQRFEIVGVSLGPDDPSGVRARIVDALDQFHDVASDTDRNIAKLLNDLQVHIAIDLNGRTDGSRPGVLACRPAPIQVSYLGYAGTTGAEFIDYILADETALPFDQQPFFSEKIVHLPDCYHANDATRHIAQTPPRRDLGLPDRAVVFCCFNHSAKITAPMFDIWMRLLAPVQDSVLWLSEMNDLARANLRRAAAARVVDPGRLIFAPRMDRMEDHLARHRAADLFLDTLPYNAHSTAIDALWAGLPVLTCAGCAFAGRVGASLLKAAGLPELVTHSLTDYEAMALRLATDPALLSSSRRKLADNRPTCVLFDGDRFRRHVEAAYAAMWDIYRRGERPRGFRVEPDARARHDADGVDGIVGASR